MIVHRSGSSLLTLYINDEEMQACGFEDLEEEAARILAESAISDLGLSASLGEIEAFEGVGGALIFASLRSPRRTVLFRFRGIDSLLDASRAAKYLRPGRSSLFLLEGDYILLIHSANEALVIHMSEYAEQLEGPEGFPFYLLEHGQLLEADNALARLS